MADPSPNYFTCTLGEAAKRRAEGVELTEGFDSIIDLVEHQSTNHGETIAVGIPRLKGEVPLTLSFAEMERLSTLVAHHLKDDADIAVRPEQSRNIGLLCTSGLDFLLVWLGLMKLGYVVMVIAPQLGPNGIEALCKALAISSILLDERQDARSVPAGIKAISIPKMVDYNDDEKTLDSLTKLPALRKYKGDEAAYYHHTSGTSSGVPKPIPQTHQGVMRALPRFTDTRKVATFSTTPLYHGGLVDCLRSWTSGSMIWLFPEGAAPITESTILKLLHTARETSAARILYFSCVPFVLEMLADSANGISMLKTMDLVGVGGAAMSSSTGDRLVKSGVNLLSRYGSAECGFLMSSHRKYEIDKEWQYLRSDGSGSELLRFEPHDEGLAELIVTSKWPFRAVTNRDDGSYATADLFELHPTIQNAWRYHSRADAQLILANGKKFDPSPMETDIMAASGMLQDIYIFGTARDYPGALLFPREPGNGEIVRDMIWPSIVKINAGSQSHARIARSMLIIVDDKFEQPPLEKSSKGTTLRPKAEAKYQDLIREAYAAKSEAILDHSSSYNDICAVVSKCSLDVLGHDVDCHQDLFGQGVDSIACIHIRKSLQASLPSSAPQLPLNVIYDQATVSNLSKYLETIIKGQSDSGTAPRDDPNINLMESLTNKYSSTFAPVSQPGDEQKPISVILTGATGFLGGYLLHCLRQSPEVKKIYCLVRASSEKDARNRLSKKLSTRGRPSLDEELNQKHTRALVLCVPCDLSKPDLAISSEAMTELLRHATHIIHAAWGVNFALRLSSFEPHIAGTKYLIDLARRSGASFTFISSIAAISSSHSVSHVEQISSQPTDASDLGYSRSKWVAEQICAKAACASTLTPPGNLSQRGSLSIIRVGQLCGDSKGVWNASEAYPLLLSTGKETGCLPQLEGETLAWMPCDDAAKSIIEIVLAGDQQNLDSTSKTAGTIQQDEPSVFHVLNPHSSPSWSQMLAWIVEWSGASTLNVCPPSEWLSKLETTRHDHPARPLFALWKRAYSGEKEQRSVSDADHGSHVSKNDLSTEPRFDVTRAKEVSETMHNIQPISQQQIVKMWHWIQANV